MHATPGWNWGQFSVDWVDGCAGPTFKAAQIAHTASQKCSTPSCMGVPGSAMRPCVSACDMRLASKLCINPQRMITVLRFYTFCIQKEKVPRTTTIEDKMYLHSLKTWAPFRIDALGLVTILGADELNLAIGRLARNKYTEYLPLLGGYIIAQNSVVKPIPGFTVYNISDGIMATDVTGWFARWLTCQEFTWASTTLYISGLQMNSKPVSLAEEVGGLVLGIITLLPILTFAVAMGDWWGFANTLSMLVSVVVRRIIIGQNRHALDRATQGAIAKSPEMVKTFWTMPDGHTVTIKLPRGILMDCLLTTPRPPNPTLYSLTRIAAWIGFGCHVITLGMATLFCQMLSVALLLSATVLVASRIGDDEYRVGTHLRIERKDSEGRDFRSAAYAKLRLTEKEETSMVAWNLFPHKSNDSWWENYEECKKTDSQSAFADWDERMAKAAMTAETKDPLYRKTVTV